MAEDLTVLMWALGGGGVIAVGGYGYLMNSIGKISDSISATEADLAAHKTQVAENYLTKSDFNIVAATINKNFDKLEQRIADGTKANLESNERINAKIDNNQNTIVTMLSNNQKLSAEMTSGNAAIIAAIGAAKGHS